MRIEAHLALVLMGPFFACTCEQDAEVAVGTQLPDGAGALYARMTEAEKEAFVFDIAQSTCALYVAIRSGALESPVAFGRDPEGVGVHWNMCPGGTMVACVAAPTATGDTVRTGIPWPY
jgi:hypothetical protein